MSAMYEMVFHGRMIPPTTRNGSDAMVQMHVGCVSTPYIGKPPYTVELWSGKTLIARKDNIPEALGKMDYNCIFENLSPMDFKIIAYDSSANQQKVIATTGFYK